MEAPQPPSAHTVADMNNVNGPRRKTSLRREGSSAVSANTTQVAHTLTACCRCRQRKTRCDPGLPRCGPCERTKSVCEYFDSSKGRNVNRSYVVYLQHKVRELETELERVESEDSQEDPEAMMRSAAVRMHDATETKFLGPSSGIAITRLVMQLAKQFTDAKSIKDIVPDAKARQVKELYAAEQGKPTSKIYPLTSDVPALDLPNRGLADLLVQLYNLKVQPMYPALHEPSFANDLEAVYADERQASAYQNFVVRMVISISLQKMDTQYAGLADSYYLAALKFLEPVVRPMDLRTLQCFALMAEYSLLTPTRTAIYYVVGMAVRLLQALGFNEEKTITRGAGGAKVDCLEIDMRRRVFWCLLVMECGLSHALGRPAILATNQDHLDVDFFETVDDRYITREGISAAAPRPTLKKWIAIHFFKMRLLQLEIRRKLYQRKRASPKDDNDQWFLDMDGKLAAWRDASPTNDEGIGLDKIWFIGRYNTMVVFLFRPSPQVPRPSLVAAQKCFDACEYNIYMQREQITKKNVDLTWIFTQSIFMAINTMLWSLSYVEVRKKHSRQAVERHLDVAMEAIQLASERWPGVASAVQLYQNLIDAVLKIYEKDGDVPISAGTPSDPASPGAALSDGANHSRTTSPAAVSQPSISTPPPFGYINQPSQRRSVEQPPPVPYQSHAAPSSLQYSTVAPQQAPPLQNMPFQSTSTEQVPQLNQPYPTGQDPQSFDPYSTFNPLPEYTPELTISGWQTAYTQPQYNPYAPYSTGTSQTQPGMPLNDSNLASYFPPLNALNGSGHNSSIDQLYPPYWVEDTGTFGSGLNLTQQQELMQTLETDGMEDIQSMITASNAVLDQYGSTTSKEQRPY